MEKLSRRGKAKLKQLVSKQLNYDDVIDLNGLVESCQSVEILKNLKWEKVVSDRAADPPTPGTLGEWGWTKLASSVGEPGAREKLLTLKSKGYSLSPGMKIALKIQDPMQTDTDMKSAEHFHVGDGFCDNKAAAETESVYEADWAALKLRENAVVQKELALSQREQELCHREAKLNALECEVEAREKEWCLREKELGLKLRELEVRGEELQVMTRDLDQRASSLDKWEKVLTCERTVLKQEQTLALRSGEMKQREARIKRKEKGRGLDTKLGSLAPAPD